MFFFMKRSYWYRTKEIHCLLVVASDIDHICNSNAPVRNKTHLLTGHLIDL